MNTFHASGDSGELREQWIDLAALRIAFRFAACTLADPRRLPYAVWREMGDDPLLRDGCAVIRELPASSPPQLGVCDRPLDELDPDPVLVALPSTAELWNQAYEQTFGLLVSGPAPLHETEYISGKLSFQRSHALADIAGFYRAFGVAVPEETPERPDQIVIELEFMARLIELEEQARRQTLNGTAQQRQVEVERATVCLEARRRFFTEHLGWWAPGLARLLIEGDSHPFYQAGARFLAALLTAQRALLGAAPSQRVAVPSPPEETGPCDDCLVANLGPN